MKRRTVVIVVLVVLFGLCLAAIGAGISFLLRIPPVTEQIHEGATPVHVQLFVPATYAGFPLNSFIPVAAQARGGGTITTLELYINGQLYEKLSAPDGWSQPELTHIWDWQPGAAGRFILVARASNTEGGTGSSDPVLLEVRDAVGMVTPFQTVEGDTLAAIAAANGIDPTALEEANPQIDDPTQALPVDSSIDLPNPPVPISNPHIIQGFSAPEDLNQPPVEPDNPPPSPDEGSAKGGLSIPSLQDIQFWLGEKTAGDADSLPLIPWVNYTYSGCEATLTIWTTDYKDGKNDPKRDEEGFFIYQSQDGGPFKRVATLPPVKNEADWKYKDGYKLANQTGLTTYTIAAFNHAGEAVSTPVVVDFSGDACQPGNSGRSVFGAIRMEEGDLILPYKMDLAYLYLSVDDSSSMRVPEGHRMFQPQSGVKLNIYDYLSEKMPAFTAADFNLKMEVWGWSGGELKFVGNFEDTIHRTLLLVCSQEGEGACTGGGGTWVTQINFSDQKPVNEQVFEFKWIATTRSEAEDVCIQAAAAPYPDGTYWNMGYKPIYAGCYYWDGKEYVTGSEGTFTQHMQYLLYEPTPADDLGWGAGSEGFNFGSNWFAGEYPPDSAFTLYFRVLPHMKAKGYTQFSNTVTIHHNTPPAPSDLPPLASPYNSLYSVEILRDTYQPPIFQTDDKWGCVIVDEDPTGNFAPGQEVCPPPYGTLAKMNSEGCEGNWDFWCVLKGVYTSFAEAYDSILFWYDYTKTWYATMIAETIPYCGGNEKCIGVIKKVINEVIEEGIGIPENPPKSDELVSKNMAKVIMNSTYEAEKYYTEQDFSVIESACALAKCEEKLAKAIQQEIQHQRSVKAQPACTDSYQAYFKGKDAICLDPAIIVHAAPGGKNSDGMVTIRIIRKMNSESTGALETDADKHRLHVVVTGENDYSSGELYPASLVEIPWTAPGESAYISVPFQIIGGEINEPLYFGNISHMKAVEACYSPDSPVEWVPCLDGGADSWDFRNPPDKYHDEVGQP
jgi:hypothetical protein